MAFSTEVFKCRVQGNILDAFGIVCLFSKVAVISFLNVDTYKHKWQIFTRFWFEVLRDAVGKF